MQLTRMLRHANEKSCRIMAGLLGVICALLLSWGGVAQAVDAVVTNTSPDAGTPGSLGYAVNMVNAGADGTNTISFDASLSQARIVLNEGLTVTLGSRTAKSVALRNDDATNGLSISLTDVSNTPVSWLTVENDVTVNLAGTSPLNIYVLEMPNTGQALATGLSTMFAPLLMEGIGSGVSLSATAVGGKLVAASEATASAVGLYGSDGIILNGGLAGNITATASGGSADTETATALATAYGLNSGGPVTLGGDLSGQIIVTAMGGSATTANGPATVASAESTAAGLRATGAVTLNGSLSGTVSVAATGGLVAVAEASDLATVYNAATAYGVYGCEGVSLTGALSGTVNAAAIGGFATATATTGGTATAHTSATADGLAADGALSIGAGLSGILTAGATGGTATATAGTSATAESNATARGLSAAGDLSINGGLSGTVTATAMTGSATTTASGDSAFSSAAGTAIGLSAGGNLTLTGGLSGTVTSQATGGVISVTPSRAPLEATATATAYGLYSQGSTDLAGALAGTVTATANGGFITDTTAGSPVSAVIEAETTAFALFSEEGLVISDVLSGGITATATGATIMGSSGENPGLRAADDVYAAALSTATGLYASEGLVVAGNLSGPVAATATGSAVNVSSGSCATALAASNSNALYGASGIVLTGDVSSAITATATSQEATATSAQADTGSADASASATSTGLTSGGTILLLGKLTGSITTTATGGTATTSAYEAFSSSTALAKGLSASQALLSFQDFSGMASTEAHGGTATATGGYATSIAMAGALGLYGPEALSLRGGLSGTLATTAVGGTATATASRDAAGTLADAFAFGLTTSDDFTLIEGLSGSVTTLAAGGEATSVNTSLDPDALATATGTADAASVNVAGAHCTIFGGLSGTVTTMGLGGKATATTSAASTDAYGAAEASARAVGFSLDQGDLTITNGLSGTITTIAQGGMASARGGAFGYAAATATATSLSTSGNLFITGGLSGTIITTATGGSASAVGGTAAWADASATAYGLFADGDITITEGLSGTIATTATGGTAFASLLDGTETANHTALATAYGIYAGGALNGSDAETPLLLSGSVSATTNTTGQAVAVASTGAMNLYVTGTLRGVDQTGGDAAYAILAGNANDTVTLATGANLTGKVDLGGGTDTLTLVGTGSLTSQVLNVENLTVGDALGTATAWLLAPTGTSTFDSLTLFDNADLTLGSNVAITGVTAINNGKLQIASGTTLSGALVIGANGTLGGYGTVGSVTNNGTVAPGGSIGTLTVAGDYTQAASATYHCEVSPTASDLLAVTGSASLAGTLSIVPEQGLYTAGRTWTILTAGNGRTGTFGTVTATETWNLHFSPAYTANSVTVSVSRLSYATAAQSSRAAAVAAGLDNAVATATGEMASLLTALDFSSPAAANLAMGLLSAESYDAYTQTMLEGGRALTATQRGVLRGETVSDGGVFAQAQDMGPTAVVAMAGADMRPSGLASGDAAPQLEEGQYTVFLQPFGLHSRQYGDANRTGYEAYTGGLTGGLLYRPTANLTLGLAPSFMTQSVSLRTNGTGSGTVQDWSVALLAGYRRGPWHVDAVGRVGFDTFDSSHSLPLPGVTRTAKGRWNGWNTSLSAATGYDFKAGGYTYGPIASLEWQYLGQDAFSETGAGTVGQHVGARHNHSLRTVLGARVSRTFETAHGSITPELRAGWAAQWLDQSQGIDASFTGVPLSGYQARVSGHAYHAALIDAGVTMRVNEQLSASVRAGVELFRPKHESQAISIGLKYSF